MSDSDSSAAVPAAATADVTSRRRHNYMNELRRPVPIMAQPGQSGSGRGTSEQEPASLERQQEGNKISIRQWLLPRGNNQPSSSQSPSGYNVSGDQIDTHRFSHPSGSNTTVNRSTESHYSHPSVSHGSSDQTTSRQFQLASRSKSNGSQTTSRHFQHPSSSTNNTFNQPSGSRFSQPSGSGISGDRTNNHLFSLPSCSHSQPVAYQSSVPSGSASQCQLPSGSGQPAMPSAPLSNANRNSGHGQRLPWNFQWSDPGTSLSDESLGVVLKGPFMCKQCGSPPTPPVTGICGHTRCRACAEASLQCPCGDIRDTPIVQDFFIEELLSNLTEAQLRVLARVPTHEQVREVLDRPAPGVMQPNGYPPDYNATMRFLSSESDMAAVQLIINQWIQKGDLDCTVCGEIVYGPIMAPCGHTFCRTCIERTMDHRPACPLCTSSLEDYNTDVVKETVFIRTALIVSGTPQRLPENACEERRLPLFVCTLAVPTVPCPLIVFEPRYRLMLRRCLRSGTRKFGMVMHHPHYGYLNFGTILVVRDCVRMRNGEYLISTIGMARFVILERGVVDGYDVAKFRLRFDYLPNSLLEKMDLHNFSNHVRRKAEVYVYRLANRIKTEINSYFGPMPPEEEYPLSVESPQGPAWVWQIISLLPFSTFVKAKMLWTNNLRYRLVTLDRTLDFLLSYMSDSSRHSVPNQLPPYVSDALDHAA